MIDDKLLKLLQFDDLIPFSTEWLDVADYELKILVLTSLLAENNLAYRGTLKTMSEWLGISQSANSNKKIKEAIYSLEKQGYIFYKLDGRTWTITISEKGMKDKQIVRIRKIWINVIKDIKDEYYSVSWIKILKVFVYLFNKKSGAIVTNNMIAKDLNISEKTVSNALNVLEKHATEFPNLRIHRFDVKEQVNYRNMSYYIPKGTEYDFILLFE